MRIWEIREKLPKVKLWIQVDDGTESLLHGAIDFERAIRGATPAPRINRPADDVYMLYTGGTTGMPKGVMYPNGSFCKGLATGGLALHGLAAPETPEGLPNLVRQIKQMGALPVSLAACPQMHGTGLWLGTLLPMLCGGAVVTISKLGLDPDALFAHVEAHRVTDIAIVGDAFAKPMLGALDAAQASGQPYDLSSLKRIISSGVMWSSRDEAGAAQASRHDVDGHDGFHRRRHGKQRVDARQRRGNREVPAERRREGIHRRRPCRCTGVRRSRQDRAQRISPAWLLQGSEEVRRDLSRNRRRSVQLSRRLRPGRSRRCHHAARRGSMCINSAGEKVYPEEVEEVVKRHVAIYDCLVVGVPDDRFGERVVAVASLREGADTDPAALMEYTREHLASYKSPRHVILVEQVRRAPNGKADYKWAKATALEQLKSA
jgi:fatty-acyl-CoA synthase